MIFTRFLIFVNFHFISANFFKHIELKPSRNHAVLFNLPLPSRDHELPQPRRGAVLWDQDHVRLPSSIDSQYGEIDENGRKLLKQRWNLIEESLLQKISNSHDLEKAIKGYNTRYEDIWSFDTLHELFEKNMDEEESSEFFNNHLPKLINLALQLPSIIQSPIPLLKQEKSRSISLSQQQVACLLANAFLCTFPRRNTNRSHSEYSNYPNINFNQLFNKKGQNVIQKLRCIINYFVRVVNQMPTNIITFQRISIYEQVDWENSSVKISQTKFSVRAKGKIEQGSGMLQVDFANRFVGGGVLGHGCVQEEIRFVINPEMIVARLFTESLKDQEALIMIGCEQFNSYSGYSSSFRWGGDYFDTTPLDIYNRRKCRVVAIDALSYKNSYDQFKEKNLRRDLMKAYVGFYSESENNRSPVASGLWGCGAFNGNAIRSALIQLMACSLVQRNLVIYTFGDIFVRNEIMDIYTFLEEKDLTVGQLYKLLAKYRTEGHPNDPDQVIPFIRKQFLIASSTNHQKSSSSVQNHEENFNYVRQKSTEGEAPSKASRSSQQPSLLSFFVPRPSISLSSGNVQQQDCNKVLSTSSNQGTSESALNFQDKDKEIFNRIANTFKKKPEKPSLLDCLDEDMNT